MARMRKPVPCILLALATRTMASQLGHNAQDALSGKPSPSVAQRMARAGNR